MCVGEYVYGVNRASHEKWSEQRKFMVKTLNELTTGDRDGMDDVIGQEAEDLANMLISKSDGIFMSNAAVSFMV